MAIIRNMGEFIKELTPQIKETLILVAEDVKKEIEKYLDNYYSEYDPSEHEINSIKGWYYNRTYQLLNCCEIGTPKINGNTISIEIYLDIDSLSYPAIGSDPYKTVVSANSGLHGGWDIDTMKQVPWSYISGNSGAAYGSGTQIWQEPIEELFDTNKIVEIFKKYARQRGLYIK